MEVGAADMIEDGTGFTGRRSNEGMGCGAEYRVGTTEG
jgi:hypothetical protein